MGTSDARDGGRRRILILVHGTFARQTEWVQERSFLARHLVDHTSVSTQLHRFEWSGGNSHGDRLDAGWRLRHFIEKVAAENGEADIFVIAHSHGGNVALYALNDRVVAEKVSGLVTMGTPFLNVRCRNLLDVARVNRVALPLVAAVAWTALLIVPLIILGAFSEEIPYSMTISTVFAFSYIAITPFMILLLVLPRCTSLMRTFYRHAKGMQRCLWRRMRYDEALKTPLLRISVRGDEAWLLLYSSWLAGVVPTALWATTIVVATFAIPISLVMYTFGLIYTTLGNDENFMVGIGLAAVLVALVALPLVVMICQIGMATIPRIVRYMAFGPETCAETFLLFVEPDLDPTGMSRKVLHIKDLRRSFWAFNHCRIYEHDDVATQISQWLENPICSDGRREPVIMRHGLGLLWGICSWVWKGIR